jgi:hypothetical protein
MVKQAAPPANERRPSLGTDVGLDPHAFQAAQLATADYYGEYNADGVDLSLLRYLLQLSPLERLKLMERHARDTQILFEYGRRHREAQAGRDR